MNRVVIWALENIQIFSDIGQHNCLQYILSVCDETRCGLISSKYIICISHLYHKSSGVNNINKLHNRYALYKLKSV